MRYYEQERECIDMFREEYEFLSNFYPAKMEFEGIAYHSSEAAYQAQKCKNPEDKILFANMYADEAKRFGRKVEMREDWEEVKVDLMQKIVIAKFAQHPELAVRLLETGKKPLKEGNYWGDVFWGIDHRTGEGENHLGRILMELRETYQTEGLSGCKKSYPVKRFGPIRGITISDEDIIQCERRNCEAACIHESDGCPVDVRLAPTEAERRHSTGGECLRYIECIVNAANKTLLGGSGVDGAIHREAGPELLEECRSLNGCETGQAKLTKAYNLKAKYVIHAVGPVYGKDEESLLEVCYHNTLNLAKEHDIHSIVFPPLSTGKFCFPKKKAIETGIRAVSEWLEQHNDYKIEVFFFCVDQKIFQYACEYLKKE